jgi:hypothetical protein
MGRRYGRNQKRAHRAEIERLHASLVYEKGVTDRAWRLAQRAMAAELAAKDDARNAAANAVNAVIQKHEMVKYAVEDIARRLTEGYAPKLAEAAQQVIAAGERIQQGGPRHLRISARAGDISRGVPTVEITGEIPLLKWRLVFSNLELGVHDR